ncbi:MULTISPECIES: hypothetical protein [unclassified Mammaliicoccus]|uniref:hypothetical protein n=1 Tax=unclassified Mammaliicoccus TaxID=2803851 RepID=UPI001EFBE928|nr:MULTISPECIES: hypothetical protein [unclassified Mammaliicoccus]
MPTIKRKVEMNLPQLIEWGWDNPEQIKGKYFKSNVKDVFGNYSIVQFSVDSFGFKTDEIRRNDTFTVEIEEQIDEDTELTALVELSSRGLLGNTRLYRYHSINDVIDNQSVAFYILNDDQTMDLIWKNGKLVE